MPVIEENDITEKQSSLLKRTNTAINNKNAKTIHNRLNIEECVKKLPPQSITISKGGLKLAVNFPSDATVKFQNGHTEQFLMNKMCSCKRFAISAL